MSLSRSEQSRINGSKSRGPKTEEGKQRSSRNACKHGLAAATFVLLESERDDDGFDRLLQAFIARFQPADEIEYELIYEAAAARWKLRRAWSLEVSSIDIQVEDRRELLESRFDGLTDRDHLTYAFQRLAGSGLIGNLNRYQSRIRREFERALRDLEYIRSGRIKPPAPPVHPEILNEPEPARTAAPKKMPALVRTPAAAQSKLPNEPEPCPPARPEAAPENSPRAVCESASPVPQSDRRSLESCSVPSSYMWTPSCSQEAGHVDIAGSPLRLASAS
jgi:hypothetical protein